MSNENLDGQNIEVNVTVSDEAATPEVPHETETPENIPATETVPASDEPVEPPEEQDLSTAPLPGDEPVNQKTLPHWAEKRLARKDVVIQQKEAEVAAARAELARLTALSQQQTPSASVPDPSSPRRDQYLNDADYFEAMTQHALVRHMQASRNEAERQKYEASEQNFQNNIKKARDAGIEKYEDFAEKVNPMFSDGFPPNRAMAEAIATSEHKEDMLYFLGSNLKEAREIAKLNPIETVKKIAQIEMRFNARKNVQSSKAPAPLTPLNSTQVKGQSVDNLEQLVKNSEKMSQREFEESFKKLSSQRSPW